MKSGYWNFCRHTTHITRHATTMRDDPDNNCEGKPVALKLSSNCKVWGRLLSKLMTGMCSTSRRPHKSLIFFVRVCTGHVSCGWFCLQTSHVILQHSVPEATCTDWFPGAV